MTPKPLRLTPAMAKKLGVVTPKVKKKRGQMDPARFELVLAAARARSGPPTETFHVEQDERPIGTYMVVNDRWKTLLAETPPQPERGKD